jgi:CO dehydrogenase/acetyl-CoA synthase beta subunit
MRDVTDTIEFAKKHCRLSTMSSFVRQLNKYDFHKINNTISKDGIESWEFTNALFRRDDTSWREIRPKKVNLFYRRNVRDSVNTTIANEVVKHRKENAKLQAQLVALQSCADNHACACGCYHISQK